MSYRKVMPWMAFVGFCIFLFALNAKRSDNPYFTIISSSVAVNADFTVSVRDDCVLSGYSQDKSSQTFFVNCADVGRTLTIDKPESLVRFDVVKANQSEPIKIKPIGHIGIDWDKVKKHIESGKTS